VTISHDEARGLALKVSSELIFDTAERNRRVESMLAYIDAAEAATTWRDMDSAPRDHKVWLCVRSVAGAPLVRALGRFTDDNDADGWATDWGYYRSANVLAWFPIPELPPTGLEGGR
jgi:hypothetical protein